MIVITTIKILTVVMTAIIITLEISNPAVIGIISIFMVLLRDPRWDQILL